MDLPEASTSRINKDAAAHLRDALSKVDQLLEEEEQNIAKRAQKRSSGKAPPADLPPAKACSACRKAKNKCGGSVGEGACSRCLNLSIECVFPRDRTRGPKKRLSNLQRTLLDIRRSVEAVLTGSGPLDPLDGDSEEELEELKEGGGGGGDDDSAAFLRNPVAILAPEASELRYSAATLDVYQPEFDLSADPVGSNLLRLSDLERLLRIYFDRLRPFIWLLLPELHTQDFLRLNSPFLTTTIAFIASTYDPLSAHLSLALERHAQQLAANILDGGLKSLEIVQAFFLLSHWTSPDSARPSSSRAFHYFGQAWIMATELRINHPSHDPTTQYRTAVGAEPPHPQLIAQNRLLSWQLLFCGELAIFVQSGRSEYLRAPPPPSKTMYPSPPPYNFLANLDLNSFFASALHLANGLDQETSTEELRLAFVSSWKPKMEAWRARWLEINPFIDIHGENDTIMLHLMSLRYKGAPSTTSILAECKEAAMRCLQKATSWEDRETELAFCSNYVIVNIAYGAVLLLQLALRFDRVLSDSLRTKVLRVAAILERVGQNRPNAVSLAVVHAERIRRLVDTFFSTPALAPQPPTLPLCLPDPPPAAAHTPYQDPFSDPSHSSGDIAIGNNAFASPYSNSALDFLDMSMQDPTLHWLWGGDDGTPGMGAGDFGTFGGL